jgi:hypothetical protein
MEVTASGQNTWGDDNHIARLNRPIAKRKREKKKKQKKHRRRLLISISVAPC